MRGILLALLVTLAPSATAQDLVYADGIEDCSMMDHDDDRLRGCEEVFGNISDPDIADTDGDGLIDGDEVLATSSGLNLRLLGAKPKRRTIFVEIDWVEDTSECIEGAHSHRPADVAITKAQAVFAAAQTPNPDGSTGIDLRCGRIGSAPPAT